MIPYAMPQPIFHCMPPMAFSSMNLVWPGASRNSTMLFPSSLPSIVSPDSWN